MVYGHLAPLFSQTSINTDFPLSITSNLSFTEPEFHYSTCQMWPETTWKSLRTHLGAEAAKTLLGLHQLNCRTQLDDLPSPWALLPSHTAGKALCSHWKHSFGGVQFDFSTAERVHYPRGTRETDSGELRCYLDKWNNYVTIKSEFQPSCG